MGVYTERRERNRLASLCGCSKYSGVGEVSIYLVLACFIFPIKSYFMYNIRSTVYIVL
jgi:hypothetical protein